MRALVRFVIVFAVSGLIAAPIVASGHTSSNYYHTIWMRDLSQNWAFTTGFPTGEWRTRVRDGVRQWNALNQPMTFAELGQSFNNFDPLRPCARSYGENRVHWTNYDGGGNVLAYVSSCTNRSTSEIINAQLNFDPQEDWYTGTGDASDGFLELCIPSCQIDAWSIASHEWGHMTGFSGPYANGHFNPDESICDDNVDQETMCPSYSPGSERMRGLGTHDKHTFTGGY